MPALIAVSEVMRAVLDVRAAGIPVIVLIGGANGCFGGMGIVARCCRTIVMSEQGRLALSGPEVIETVARRRGIRLRDRALVWRTTGGHAAPDRRLRPPVEDTDRRLPRGRARADRGAPRLRSRDARGRAAAPARERLERFGDGRDAPVSGAGLGVADPDGSR